MRSPVYELPGRLQRVQLDKNEPRRRREDIIHYTVMPFGLKNAGATYQKMMDIFCKDHIGKNLEVYVDDMVVKTKEGGNHIEDLEEIFRQLRKYNMKLNPSNYNFRSKWRQILGFHAYT